MVYSCSLTALEFMQWVSARVYHNTQDTYLYILLYYIYLYIKIVIESQSQSSLVFFLFLSLIY